MRITALADYGVICALHLARRPDEGPITGREIAAAAGDLFAWGSNRFGQLGDGTTTLRRVRPVDISTPEPFTVIIPGRWPTLALTPAGKAYTWWRNDFGQLGDARRRTETSRWP